MMGASLVACSTSGMQGPESPAAVVQQPSPASATQGAALRRICTQNADVSISKCGQTYAAYPTGLVADAPTLIFDISGAPLDSCGGFRYFPTDEAREAHDRKCATYLVGCTQVLSSCAALQTTALPGQ
jgi:hypothetical protein